MSTSYYGSILNYYCYVDIILTLGIGYHDAGGAERLVVDAALGIQNKGHTVSIHTSHHDPSHCFDETKDGEFVSLRQGICY